MRLYMNVVEAGYELLVLLAFSDKEYHAKEATEIKNFLNINMNNKHEYCLKNHIEISLDTIEERLTRLIELAEFFKEKGSKSDHKKMISFALKLVIADRKLKPQEEIRFKIIAEYWDINLEEFIQAKLKSKK